MLDKFRGKYKLGRCFSDAFIKITVGRSHGNCTAVSLPRDCNTGVLRNIATSRFSDLLKILNSTLYFITFIGRKKILSQGVGLGVKKVCFLTLLFWVQTFEPASSVKGALLILSGREFIFDC